MRFFVILSVTLALAIAGLTTPACGPTGEGEKATETTPDAGPKDTATGDKGSTDTGGKDTAPTDNGIPDPGPTDTGPTDTGPTDTGTPDSGPTDTGPTDTGPADTGPADTGPADTPADGGTEPVPEKTNEANPDKSMTSNVPTSGTALFNWLKAGNYKNFPAESKVHGVRSDSAHSGGVRVFINPLLDNSLKSGTKIHPKGAALIKELWTGDFKTLRGWAVQVKIDADSKGGQGWYWYEIFSTTSPNNPFVDGVGDSRCTGCHGSGTHVDFMKTNYPLQ